MSGPSRQLGQTLLLVDGSRELSSFNNGVESASLSRRAHQSDISTPHRSQPEVVTTSGSRRLGEPFDLEEIPCVLTRLGKTYLPARVAKKLESSLNKGALAGEISCDGVGEWDFSIPHDPAGTMVLAVGIFRIEKRRL